MAPVPYTVETITNSSGLQEIEPAWNRLSYGGELQNVFATCDWFRAWNARYTRDFTSARAPYVLTLRRGEEIAGIVPLVRVVSSHAGIRAARIEFAGQEWDYNDLVVGDGFAEMAAAAIGHLAKERADWDFVQLRKLRASEAQMARLCRELDHAGLRYRIFYEAQRCPYLRLNEGWEEMLQRFSPSTRHSFRVRQSRLERRKSSGLQIRIQDAPHEEPGLLERMIAVEAQKQVRGKPSVPYAGRYRDVFDELFRGLGPRGVVSVALMEWKENLIAWNLFFRCGRKIWGYLTAYDRRYANLSPGTMLLPAIIEDGHRRGYEEFDFLSGDDRYKSRWTTDEHRTFCVRMDNPQLLPRLRSRLYLALRPGLPVGPPWVPENGQSR